jgi:hypothetical protein
MKANDSDRDSTILYIQYNPPHHHYSVSSSNANSNKPSCFCLICATLRGRAPETPETDATGPLDRTYLTGPANYNCDIILRLLHFYLRYCFITIIIVVRPHQNQFSA